MNQHHRLSQCTHSILNTDIHKELHPWSTLYKSILKALGNIEDCTLLLHISFKTNNVVKSSETSTWDVIYTYPIDVHRIALHTYACISRLIKRHPKSWYPFWYPGNYLINSKDFFNEILINIPNSGGDNDQNLLHNHFVKRTRPTWPPADILEMALLIFFAPQKLLGLHFRLSRSHSR